MNLAHARRAAFAAGLGAVLGWGCSREAEVSGAGSDEPRGEARVVAVSPKLVKDQRIEIVEVELRVPEDELLVSGQVVAPSSGQAEIGALLDARVREVDAGEGSVVKKGDLLAVLDAPDAARVLGSLSEARARRQRAESVLRQEERLAQQKATSARQLALASSEVATAQAEETAARMLLDTYGVSGGRVLVRSPIDGIVARARAVLGGQVNSGSVLFRIVDPSQLIIRADVPECFASSVSEGSEVKVFGPDGAVRCQSKVEASNRSVDPVKRTVTYRVRPGAQCPDLLEGGFVNLALRRVGLGETGRRAAVPRAAVVEVEGVPVVFVPQKKPGTFQLRAVRVARLTEHMAYLADGVGDQEHVVARGAFLLKGEYQRASLE